jgi:phosphopantothenoylcysteine decarboxylase/phosphopantothenate--cysteine ligase
VKTSTHTSKLIVSSLSSFLQGRSVALCVTGSVAAVECVNLARLLMRHGAGVFPVMSLMAQKIIHPYLLEWATGNEVVTELTGKIEHIALAGKHDEHVDLVIIAPATANTIGKIANGIDDTPVTTTASSALGAGIPVLVVPAMHESMYNHPAVLENIKKLQEFGVEVMSPRMEEAKAKIPDSSYIIEKVFKLLGPKDLVGRRFVVTAGPTRGWIDRVRFITNPSTGKMGIAIAQEILARGGAVNLILGPTFEKPPMEANVTRVETSEDMYKVVMSTLSENNIDAFISTAAVLDFIPEKTEDKKIQSGQNLSINLVPSSKIINEVRKKYKDLLIVGFKVESGLNDDELEARARKKITEGICDLVVANDEKRKGVAFGVDTNEVIVVGPKQFKVKISLAPKREVARQIMDIIVEKITD